MPIVTLEGFIVVPYQDLALVEKELPNHIRLTRQEPGCIKFEISKDSQMMNRFHVYEEFKDQKSFELHQHRVQRSRWGHVSVNVVRHYQVNGF